jgi:hypothetical protein
LCFVPAQLTDAKQATVASTRADLLSTTRQYGRSAPIERGPADGADAAHGRPASPELLGELVRALTRGVEADDELLVLGPARCSLRSPGFASPQPG